VKDLYDRKLKSLKKEIKDLRRWKDCPCSWIGWINRQDYNGYLAESNLQIQWNPHQNSHPTQFFTELGQFANSSGITKK
jgi:hypothetical protein